MNAFQVLMIMGWDCKAGHDTAKGRAWKGKHRRADRPTPMENKKAFSLLKCQLQLMEITLNCFRIHICIMTLYTLGFKTAEQGRLGYNEIPVLYVPAAATELHKTHVCYEYGYAQGRYHTIPTRR